MHYCFHHAFLLLGLIFNHMQNGEKPKDDVPSVNNGECYLDQKMHDIIFPFKILTTVVV